MENIKYHYTNKGVGNVDALRCELGNVTLHIFAMKEEYCAMILMFTNGTNERVSKEKIWIIGGDRTTFEYPETVHNNQYQHRDSMDSHNSRCKSPIALEETWSTRRWVNHVFEFLLDLSEVNDNLRGDIFIAWGMLGQCWSSEENYIGTSLTTHT